MSILIYQNPVGFVMTMWLRSALPSFASICLLLFFAVPSGNKMSTGSGEMSGPRTTPSLTEAHELKSIHTNETKDENENEERTEDGKKKNDEQTQNVDKTHELSNRHTNNVSSPATTTESKVGEDENNRSQGSSDESSENSSNEESSEHSSQNQ
jgi:hypothetical protein